jgi:hypothetical protein
MFSTGTKDIDIDINSLVTTHNKRKDTRLKVYKDIYSKCCIKIKYINDVLFERECYFSVPAFRWGCPAYQHKAALGYVMICLRGKGMDVRYLNDDTIYINWSKLIDNAMNDAFPARNLDTIDGLNVDTADTTVPKPTNITLRDDRFDKIAMEGCGGDCCKEKESEKPKVLNKSHRLELARQQQQYKINNLIRRKMH